MVYSMTGFARVQIQEAWGELTWELRSVNHRYLETHLHLPEELRTLETKCRHRAATRIKRGKLDCNLKFKRLLSGQQHLQIDKNLVEQLIHLGHEVDTYLLEPSKLSALDILRWPGIVKEPELALDTLAASAMNAFEQALDSLLDMRRSEGARLAQLLTDRCHEIETIIATVRTLQPHVIRNIRQKLDQRLAEITERPDQDRLEQELVLQAQKLDINEELDRLESHIQEVHTTLKREEPVGRRLDFLMQEFNREANTLGAKSSHVKTTRASVDLKVLIEQMREQVQNIE